MVFTPQYVNVYTLFGSQLLFPQFNSWIFPLENPVDKIVGGYSGLQYLVSTQCLDGWLAHCIDLLKILNRFMHTS